MNSLDEYLRITKIVSQSPESFRDSLTAWRDGTATKAQETLVWHVYCQESAAWCVPWCFKPGRESEARAVMDEIESVADALRARRE